MFTKTQVATGSGAAAAGAGGTAIGVSLNVDREYDMNKASNVSHDFTLLAWEDDYSSVYGTSNGSDQTVGNKYAWYLTGTYGIKYKNDKHKLDLQNNEKWWNWAFNRWKADTYGKSENSTGDFSGVKSAYVHKGSSDSTALNKVCESIYKKKVSELTDTTNLLRYCSPMGKKPVLVKDSSFYGPQASNSSSKYGDGTYGDTKKDTLVSVYESGNDANNMFFILQDHRFFGKNFEDGEGKSLSTSGKVFYDAYQKRTQEPWDHISEVCTTAYQKNSNGTDVEQDALEKYCTLDIK